MRKLICLLTLVILLLPMVASAQATCCELKGTVKYENTTYNNGIWVSETRLATVNACRSGSPIINIDCNDVSGATNAVHCATPRWGILCVLSTVNRIFSLVFVILMAIVGIMVIVGAFTIVTAGGDPNKVTQGRNYIMYAVAGMVVAFFARAIPAIVALIL